MSSEAMFRRVGSSVNSIEDKMERAKAPLLASLKEIDVLLRDSRSIKSASDGNYVVRNLMMLRESIGRSILAIDSSYRPREIVARICREESQTESLNGQKDKDRRASSNARRVARPQEAASDIPREASPQDF